MTPSRTATRMEMPVSRNGTEKSITLLRSGVICSAVMAMSASPSRMLFTRPFHWRVCCSEVSQSVMIITCNSCLRQILNITRRDRITNEAILTTTGLTLLQDILSKRKASLFGHILDSIQMFLTDVSWQMSSLSSLKYLNSVHEGDCVVHFIYADPNSE